MQFIPMGRNFVPENIMKFLYYRLVTSVYYLREFLFPPANINYKDIPVIINNYNRLDSLKKLISSLEARGYFNIYIIDNLSTYPPLIDFYKECKYKIFRLPSNLGSDAFWKSGICREFNNNFFVYTDSDVVPVEECPDDFLLVFLNMLRKHKLAQKVGFLLKLDDIPDCNLLKNSIQQCEGHFLNSFKRDELFYWAPIATTFALYRPHGKRKHSNGNIEMYRTGYPYIARHLPWYVDTVNPDDEEKYYMEHLEYSTYWTTRSKNLFEAGEK